MIIPPFPAVFGPRPDGMHCDGCMGVLRVLSAGPRTADLTGGLLWSLVTRLTEEERLERDCLMAGLIEAGLVEVCESEGGLGGSCSSDCDCPMGI
mmetsp:Transcript_21956/g.28007  ORF Transcript_21956/g.28007 Transcript_21956/m.28007 type:complete len:95 (+) Transcript_21956:1116-1400(+)